MLVYAKCVTSVKIAPSGGGEEGLTVHCYYQGGFSIAVPSLCDL